MIIINTMHHKLSKQLNLLLNIVMTTKYFINKIIENFWFSIFIQSYKTFSINFNVNSYLKVRIFFIIDKIYLISFKIHHSYIMNYSIFHVANMCY